MFKRVFLAILPLSLLMVTSCGGGDEVQYDDESINEEQLMELCESGVMFNAFNGRGYGYMENVMKGRMALGNMTARDYQSMRRWFESNCPDGW